MVSGVRVQGVVLEAHIRRGCELPRHTVTSWFRHGLISWCGLNDFGQLRAEDCYVQLAIGLDF